MPISRMQQSRQQYGLGSFVKKAVKGVTGAVKKIAKSPLGLAAIGLGINQFGLPFGGAGKGFLGNIFKGGIVDSAKSFLGGEKTFGKTLGVMAGGTLLGGLLSKAEEGDEEAIAATRNVGALRSYLDKGYRNLGYKEDEIPALVESDLAEYTSGAGGYAAGGRVKFGNGSDDKSEMVKRVEELMDDGYDFGSAVKKYMEETRDEEFSVGGRVGFFKSAVAGGGNISPGTSASGGVRNDNPFTGGGGGGGNNNPPPVVKTPPPSPEPKTIRDRLKERGIETLKTSQKFNPFNFIFGTPAGAAEFDMEAFKKAGANKGFFGANDELEAIQEYYDAAKSLTAPGAKFAGANDPQAVRDFITKQSEIPFGGGSYSIDMGMVPKTFLETTEDFATQKSPISFFNLGGRVGFAFGNKPEQNAIQAAGIEGLPLNQNPAGVTELDLRETGGFIPPVGVKEKADDIPAMLANNEFVFTADAVRGMGDGNVNKGAQRMYDMMKKLEKGGKV